MTEYHERRAREILDRIAYVTIATVSADGAPWNTPVFAARDESGAFYWTSSPTSQHSRNLAADPRAFLVVYDSTAPAGEGEGVYLQASAVELSSTSERAGARSLLNAAAGGGALESDAYYRARPVAAWLNDIETEDGRYLRDCRVAIPLAALGIDTASLPTSSGTTGADLE